MSCFGKPNPGEPQAIKVAGPQKEAIEQTTKRAVSGKHRTIAQVMKVAGPQAIKAAGLQREESTTQ